MNELNLFCMLLLLLLCIIMSISTDFKRKDIIVKGLYDNDKNNANNILTKNECILQFDDKIFRCTLGKNGVISVSNKLEGDGCTPKGVYSLRESYYRSDRISPPTTKLQSFQINENDGWVDEPLDPLYNKHVKLPYNASHECLYRSDNLYDLFAVIGYNDDPVIPGKGSAIFFHVSDDLNSGTAGCIALPLADLQYVLAKIDLDSKMIIT